MGLEENNPNEEFGITSSPARLNRSDSILDIHSTVDFEETDLQESETETTTIAAQTKQAIAAAAAAIPVDEAFILPEPSKWERDDDLVIMEKSKSHRFDVVISRLDFYC